MRTLGVDCGTRRVGLALSDPLGITASPHSVVGREEAIDRILGVVADNDVGTIVIGLPTSLGGGASASTKDARNFGEELRRLTPVEVVFRDERFTTKLAEASLLESGMNRRDRRSRIDKVAAAIILQDYLDTR